jgi:hypothetical protein
MHPSQSHHTLPHISASSHQATAAKLNVCRMAFAAVQQLEPLANGVISVAAAALTKMKANCADAPYVFEKGPGGLRLIVHAGGSMTSNSARYHFATGQRNQISAL